MMSETICKYDQNSINPFQVEDHIQQSDLSDTLLSSYETRLNNTLHLIESVSRALLKLPQAGFNNVASDIHRIQRAAMQMSAAIEAFFTCADIKTPDKVTLNSHSCHDLRSPVNTIIGFSEMLLEDCCENDRRSEFGRGLHNMKKAGNQLVDALDELFLLLRRTSALITLHDLPQIRNHSQNSRTHGALTADNHGLVTGQILVVDDNINNRKLLSDQLHAYGFCVSEADSGPTALQLLAKQTIDIILLDILMPGMNGFEVLEHLKSDPKLQNIPVLVLSALDEIDSVVFCIEKGAEDYLQKPFNKVILKTKINACLERKTLRDRQAAYVRQIEVEQQKSEQLLLNTLPEPIAERLKDGEKTIADSFPEATVLFADLVNFTPLSDKIPATDLVQYLGEIFQSFDCLVEKYGLEKIKTIGDAYMLAGGVPEPRPDHAIAVALIAQEMLDAIDLLNQKNGTGFQLRIGIHSGPVVAGIIGKHKFSYDLWGDTVNVASRMESSSQPGRIQISGAAKTHLDNRFNVVPRGVIPVKGKDPMLTYWVNRA